MTTMPTIFGQLVMGPPGSGKTTYCQAMEQALTQIGRKVAICNIDPANDVLPYKSSVDISNLIRLQDVMEEMSLGPNGGLIYCMEYLEKNVDWLLDEVKRLQGCYLLLDCPGQVELYTHHCSVKNIVAALEKFGVRLCAVHLVDAHYCSDPGKFVSVALTTLCTMMQIELPHVNVLSKIDLAETYGKLDLGLEFYTETLDLRFLLEKYDADDPFTRKHHKLNLALADLVERYSLVTFIPLAVTQKKHLVKLISEIDRVNGYIFGKDGERNVQALLSCAVGADFHGTGTEEEEFLSS